MWTGLKSGCLVGFSIQYGRNEVPQECWQKLEVFGLAPSLMCHLQKYKNDFKKFYNNLQCFKTLPWSKSHMRHFLKRVDFPILEIVLLEIHQYKRKNTVVKIF